MAEEANTGDSAREQRHAANHKFILEVDYHILCMRSMLAATGYLINEINANMTDKDNDSDLEAAIVMFWHIRDRMDLIVESQNRRDDAEIKTFPRHARS